jgi:chaperone required for assembly of F1-ATPase
MNEHTKRAIRVTARAEERERVALNRYRVARHVHVCLAGRWDQSPAQREAIAARARWSVLHDLLASESDVPQETVVPHSHYCPACDRDLRRESHEEGCRYVVPAHRVAS